VALLVVRTTHLLITERLGYQLHGLSLSDGRQTFVSSKLQRGRSQSNLTADNKHPARNSSAMGYHQVDERHRSIGANIAASQQSSQLLISKTNDTLLYFRTNVARVPLLCIAEN